MTDSRYDTGNFFVMLSTQSGGYTAMTQADADQIAKFESYAEARECAKNSVLGENFGYEVFEIGHGNSH